MGVVTFGGLLMRRVRYPGVVMRSRKAAASAYRASTDRDNDCRFPARRCDVRGSQTLILLIPSMNPAIRNVMANLSAPDDDIRSLLAADAAMHHVTVAAHTDKEQNVSYI